MSKDGFKTIGTRFVEDISTAKNSDELFKILKDTCCVTLKPQAVAETIKNLDLPKASIDFKAAVARIQIAKRNEVINKQLSQKTDKESMRNYLTRYLKQEREIPQVANYTYIAMQTYLKKGMGNAEQFKQELHQHLVDGGNHKIVRDEKQKDFLHHTVAPTMMAKQTQFQNHHVTEM